MSRCPKNLHKDLHLGFCPLLEGPKFPEVKQSKNIRLLVVGVGGKDETAHFRLSGIHEGTERSQLGLRGRYQDLEDPYQPQGPNPVLEAVFNQRGLIPDLIHPIPDLRGPIIIPKWQASCLFRPVSSLGVPFGTFGIPAAFQQ